MGGNDGQLIFDTSIDQSGFEKDMSSLESTAKQGISAMADSSKSKMGEFADSAKQGLSDAANTVKSSVAEMGDSAASGFQQIAEAAKDGVNAAGKELNHLEDAAAQGIDGAEKALDGFGDVVEREVGQASETAQKDLSNMGDAAADTMQKLAAESKGKLGEFSATIKQKIGEATEQFKKNEQEAEVLQIKLDVLKSKYDETSKEVDDLTQALRQSAKEKGVDAKETQELADALDQAKKAKADFNAEISETESALKQSGSWIQRNRDTFGALKDSAIGAGKSIAAVGTALIALVEGTEDFRNSMAKLEQSGKRAGASAESLEKEMKNLYGITGDVDTSVEALSNLLSANFTGNNLQRAVEELSGAIIRFPDTLTIESLADGLQETLATGNAVGQYGELLERLGVNLDTFNADLAAATTEAERQNVALTYLSQNGLSQMAQEYRAANKDQIAYKEAQFELQKTSADLAKKALPLLSQGMSFLADNMDTLIPLIGAVVAAYGAYKVAAGAAIIATKGFTATLESNPIGMIISGITALVGGIAAVTMAINANRSETDKLIESYKTAKAERETSIQEAQAEGETIMGLATRLSTLVDANGRVVGSKAQVEAIVTRLNEKIPNLALAYDKETNSINMTADAVANLAMEEARRIVLSRKSEALADALEDQAELSGELAEAQRELAEAEAEHNKEIERGAAIGGTAAGVYQRQKEEVERLKGAVSDADAEVAKYTEETKGFVDTLYGSQEAVDSTASAYSNLAAKAKESMDAQVDYFTKGAEASDLSASKILENLKTWEEYYRSYSENLNVIMESGIVLTDTLYTKLLEGGSDSVALAAALAADIQKSGGETTEKIAELSGKVEEESGAASDALAEFATSAGISLSTAGEAAAQGSVKINQSLGGVSETASRLPGKLAPVGGEIVSGMSGGLEGATPRFQKSMYDLMQTGESSAKGKLGPYRTIGQEGAGNIASGITDGSGNLSNAASGAVEQAGESAEKSASLFTRIGDMIAKLCSQSVASNSPEVTSTVQNMVERGKDEALQSASGFVVVGVTAVGSLIEGFNTGIVSVPLTALALMAKSVETAGATRGSWVSVGKNSIQGIIDGMDARSGYLYSTVRHIVNKSIAAAKAEAVIKSPSKRFRSEVGLQMGLGVALGLEDSEKTTIKKSKELAEKTFSAAQKWIEDQKLLGNLTDADEAEVWDEIAKHYIVGSRQRIQAEKNAADARKKIEKDSFEFSKNWIAERKQYDQLSLAEELAAWERVQARYAEGTEERKEAEKEIYRIKQEINEKAKEIVDDYVEYQKEKYEEIESLEQSYQDAVSDRASAIMGEFGVFDSVDLGGYVTSDELVRNLQAQVNATEAFYNNLDALAERGVNADMVEEIRGMGVGASKQLDALLRMSDSQLQEYSDLYGEKQKIANEQALKELEPLREEIDGKISTILADVDQKFAEAQEAGRALTDGMAEGILDGTSAVAAAAIHVANEALKAMKETLQIQSPSKRGREEVGLMLGKSVGLGAIDGLDSTKDAVDARLNGIVQSMNAIVARGAVQATPAPVVTTTNINRTITQNGEIRLTGSLAYLAELLWEPMQEYGRLQGEVY